VSVSGVSRELFKAANSMIGHLRGGLGVATVLACGGFAAICGSSVATAATFSSVAYPEMRRFGYPQSFSTGVIAAGGTLGAMLPPSTVLAVYAILTQQDIGKLFMAGVIPACSRWLLYVLTIMIIVKVRPDWLPAARQALGRAPPVDLKNVWAPLVLFVFVIGGCTAASSRRPKAGGVGASGAFILGWCAASSIGPKIKEALLSATRTAAAVFTC
jgi:C4-dicarboxylate transporter DctM subunit